MRLRVAAIALIVMTAIVAAGGMVTRRSVPSIDSEALVAAALSADNTSYIAVVGTVTPYCGKVISGKATVTHDGSMERLDYPGLGNQRVCSLKIGATTSTYLPTDRRMLVSETKPMFSDKARLRLLKSNYTCKCIGTGQVAGRRVYIVDLQPRKNGRPSKRLWIDRARHTVLRSIDYSALGEERGSMETLRIAYNPRIDDDAFVPCDGGAKRVMVSTPSTPLEIRRTLGIAVAYPRFVPAGYKLDGVSIFNSQCGCSHKSAQLTYTDGLNNISVFEGKQEMCCGAGACKMSKPGDEGKCTLGGCQMANTVRLTRGGKTVVVVADLLPQDIRKIAESVD